MPKDTVVMKIQRELCHPKMRPKSFGTFEKRVCTIILGGLGNAFTRFSERRKRPGNEVNLITDEVKEIHQTTTRIKKERGW